MRPTGLLAMQKDGVVYYALKDHLGSTRVLVDEAGTVAAYFDYAPFGTLMRSGVNTDILYRYTGQEFDAESGLHNFRARLYDDELLRFYAMDPAGQTPSPYLYAGNNPVIYVDPDGRWFIVDDIFVATVSFVVGYVSHGITTNQWGGEAFLSGAISAGVGLAAYYTGGAAAGALGFAEGTAGYAITSSAAGGAVGGFLGNSANQIRYTGRLDLNQSLKAGLEGFGGGLVGGAADFYVSPMFGNLPGRHSASHVVRSIGYEVGANVFGGRPAFNNLSYGWNSMAVFAAGADLIETTSPLWSKPVIETAARDQIESLEKTAGGELEILKSSVEMDLMLTDEGLQLGRIGGSAAQNVNIAIDFLGLKGIEGRIVGHNFFFPVGFRNGNFGLMASPPYRSNNYYWYYNFYWR